jgi:hypothetical protein
MPVPLSEEMLQKLIDDQVEESLTLDYKAAAALAREDKKKEDITKDVSAMANSAGGVIVYGIREFSSKAKSHLPEKIDPVDRSLISREWLEQIIDRIRPKVRTSVHPVKVGTAVNHVVYVVEIPQGVTAHQALDLRYYKRSNSISQPMQDYEIRDILARQQHPDIKFTFLIEEYWPEFVGPPIYQRDRRWYRLRVTAKNGGTRYAKYVNGLVSLNFHLVNASSYPDFVAAALAKGGGTGTFQVSNKVRPALGSRTFGLPMFEPILPGLTVVLKYIELTPGFERIPTDGQSIRWQVCADNAPPNDGTTTFSDIPQLHRDSGPSPD